MPDRYERRKNKFKPFTLTINTEDEAMALWEWFTNGYDESGKYCGDYTKNLDASFYNENGTENHDLEEQFLKKYSISFGELVALLEEAIPSDISEEDQAKLAEHIDGFTKNRNYPKDDNWGDIITKFLEA